MGNGEKGFKILKSGLLCKKLIHWFLMVDLVYLIPPIDFEFLSDTIEHISYIYYSIRE